MKRGNRDKRRDIENANRVHNLMEEHYPEFPTALLRDGYLLPAGYQETLRKTLFRVVRYLGDDADKEGTIRQWATTYREQMGKPEWSFPPGIPPEALKDARELARLVASIDIGKEQGERAMLNALGVGDDPALASHVYRIDGASKGGKIRRDRYKKFVPEWRSRYQEIKNGNPHLSDTYICERVASYHKETYENSDTEELKSVTGRTVRNHLACR
jgi:hypothetical protein